jgi:hypothetical protein
LCTNFSLNVKWIYIEEMYKYYMQIKF